MKGGPLGIYQRGPDGHAAGAYPALRARGEQEMSREWLLAVRDEIIDALMRIEAVIATRSKDPGPTQPDRVRVANLVVDRSAHRALIDDEEISLTAKEFVLLSYLVDHVDELVSHDVLFGLLWGPRAPSGRNSLWVHVSKLRDKLTGRVPVEIRTVRKAGYRMELLDSGRGVSDTGTT